MHYRQSADGLAPVAGSIEGDFLLFRRLVDGTTELPEQGFRTADYYFLTRQDNYLYSSNEPEKPVYERSDGYGEVLIINENSRTSLSNDFI